MEVRRIASDSADSSVPMNLTFDTTDVEDVSPSTEKSLLLLAIANELNKSPLSINDLRNADFDISKLESSIVRKFVERKLVDAADEQTMQALRQIVASYVRKSEEATNGDVSTNVFLSERDFTFKSELRQGGFARIFRVTSSQHDYAIKCVFLSDSDQKRRDQLLSAEHEANLLRDLQHENIVRYFGAFSSRFRNSADVYCIQLELCGASLKDLFVERGRRLANQSQSSALPGVPLVHVCCIDERFALAVLRQLLSALSYLHECAKIAHGDITPSNVLFQLLENAGDTFNLRLCDFGLSTKLDNSCTYEPCGTPFYHAPELVLLSKEIEQEREHGQSKRGRVCDSNADATCVSAMRRTLDLTKGDVFSVGVIAYELAAPFATDYERSRCVGTVKERPSFCELGAQSRFAFDTRCSPVYRLLCAALQRDATVRPTARQLLESIS